MRRRTGGRTLYNQCRTLTANVRRRRELELLRAWHKTLGDHGVQSRLARVLDVSRQTVHRDFNIIIDKAKRDRRCPVCASGLA